MTSLRERLPSAVIPARPRPGKREAAAVEALLRSGVFDRAWYERQRGSSFPDEEAAVRDYVTRGWRTGASPHPLFEPRHWDPDWRQAVREPFSGFVGDAAGQRRRSPHPLLDLEAYVAEHPRADQHRAGPFGHLVDRLTDETELSVDRMVGRSTTLPWGRLRRVLEEQVDLWRQQERLRTAPRRSTRTSPDRAEQAFVEHVRKLPRPAPGQVPVVSVALLPGESPDPSGAGRRAALDALERQTHPAWELLEPEDPVTAASEAHGRYLAFLDPTAAWAPDFLRFVVAAMEERDLLAASTGVELRGPDGTLRYRSPAPSRDALLTGGPVDLAALVVRRDLLEEVGGLTDVPARGGDLDLVLRLLERTDVTHLPYAGATRSTASAAGAAPRGEAAAWEQAVRARHLLDWAGAEDRQRVPGRVSVLTSTSSGWRSAIATATALLETADAAPAGSPGSDLEVVVVDRAGSRASGEHLAVLAHVDPRVRVVRTPGDRGVGASYGTGLLASTGEHVVLLPLDVTLDDGWLPPLVGALRDPAVAAAVPVVLPPGGGVVGTAGGALAPYAGVPVDLLAGHPLDEVERRGTFPAPVARGGVLAARAVDLAAVRGVDPVLTVDTADADLSLRLAEQTGGRVVVVPSSRVRRRAAGGGASSEPPADAATFRQRWAGRVGRVGQQERTAEDPWAAFGLQAAHTVPGTDPSRVAGVVVVRPRSTVPDGPGAGRPSLRWAIKTAAPEGPLRDRCDHWRVAQDLATALRRLGQQVVVDTADSAVRPSAYLDDVVLVLRGRTRVAPQLGRVNLLWVLDSPDLLQPGEALAYDEVLVATRSWATAARELGRPVTPLLAATDPYRFRPGAAEPDTGPRLLVVADSRGETRSAVDMAAASGLPVVVHGAGWVGRLPGGVVASEHLPAEEVPAAYASARTVLLDHADDERARGLLSHRLFDAVATGTRVLCDAVDGVGELFDGGVATYRDEADLRLLLRTPAEEVFPPLERRREVAAEVGLHHSYDDRAATLLRVASPAQAGNAGGGRRYGPAAGGA